MLLSIFEKINNIPELVFSMARSHRRRRWTVMTPYAERLYRPLCVCSTADFDDSCNKFGNTLPGHLSSNCNGACIKSEGNV